MVLHLFALNHRLSCRSKPRRLECEVRLDLGSRVSKSWRYVCHLFHNIIVATFQSYINLYYSCKSGHMLDNVNANTVAGRELEAMTSSSKATLVAKLDKTLNANVNKVMLTISPCLFLFRFIYIWLSSLSMSNKPSSMRSTAKSSEMRWYSI
jgi:hypothetical protein